MFVYYFSNTCILHQLITRTVPLNESPLQYFTTSRTLIIINVLAEPYTNLHILWHWWGIVMFEHIFIYYCSNPCLLQRLYHLKTITVQLNELQLRHFTKKWTLNIAKILVEPYLNHRNVISKHQLIRRNRTLSITKVLAEQYLNRRNGISEQTQCESSID